MSTAVIKRIKKGSSFVYVENDEPMQDKEELARIKALAIPPSWSNVEIARSLRSKVQATGYDAAGRKQAIYNARFRARQEKLKFDRILRFASKLPNLRRQLERDIAHKRLDRDKVLATIVTLIDQAYFRVGNEKYANENGHYGITTLRSKHVNVKGDTIIFDFVGKSGQKHHKVIADKHLARIIRRLDEMPGYGVFRYQDSRGNMHDISSQDVNEYIKRIMGEEFTAKDFRTWGGTLLATTLLVAGEQADGERERKKIVTQTVKQVARQLGNTPAVCRASYIDPRIIHSYMNTRALEKMEKTVARMHPKKYLSRDEQRVLKLLEAQ